MVFTPKNIGKRLKINYSRRKKIDGDVIFYLIMVEVFRIYITECQIKNEAEKSQFPTSLYITKGMSYLYVNSFISIHILVK